MQPLWPAGKIDAALPNERRCLWLAALGVVVNVVFLVLVLLVLD